MFKLKKKKNWNKSFLHTLKKLPNVIAKTGLVTQWSFNLNSLHMQLPKAET